jgi:hypothetical protein
MYQILLKVYRHVCITKVLGEWYLAELALYRGFPDITVTGNFCSQTFMGAEVGVVLYREAQYQGVTVLL